MNCPANSFPQVNDDGSNFCKCVKDYYWNAASSSCQYVATCPPFSKIDLVNGMWKCVCDKDYLWNDKSYTCDSIICPKNSVSQYVNGKWTCVCLKDYTWNEYTKSCDYISCPARSKPGYQNNVLVCICDQDYYWNTQKKICDYVQNCGPYAVPAMVGDSWDCVCKSDCYGQGRNCKPYPICPQNSRFDIKFEKCICANTG